MLIAVRLRPALLLLLLGVVVMVDKKVRFQRQDIFLLSPRNIIAKTKNGQKSNVIYIYMYTYTYMHIHIHI
jgi:hypothetical protein